MNEGARSVSLAALLFDAETRRAGRYLYNWVRYIAMQMTNIARDVKDDFRKGRIYIPEEWFEDVGQHTPAAGPEAEFDAELFALVAERLIAEAERHYANGLAGLKYLSFRSAIATAA